MFITSIIPFRIIAISIIVFTIIAFTQQISGIFVTGSQPLPNILKMESHPIFTKSSASFVNLPARKIKLASKKLMTKASNSQKLVGTATTSTNVKHSEKTLVDSKKAIEPKIINGFEKNPFASSTGKKQNLENGKLMSEEKLKNKENEEKVLKKLLEKKQEEEKGKDYYKNYITKKVEEWTKEGENSTTSTTTTKSNKTKNILLATDLLMTNFDVSKRECYKEKAAKLAFVLNICDKFKEERNFVEHSDTILSPLSNPQPDIGTHIKELKLITKIWSLLGIRYGFDQENYDQVVENAVERLNQIINHASHTLLLQLDTIFEDLNEMKKEGEKKLSMTKKVLTTLQVVLFKTNNLRDWEVYYNEEQEENTKKEDGEDDA